MPQGYFRVFGDETTTQRYPLDAVRYRSDDGRLLEVVNEREHFDEPSRNHLKKVFDTRLCSRDPLDKSGVWRYREFLPALQPYSDIVSIPEGNTPIYDMPRCADYAGIDTLLVKHQGYNPTGSFKDNGMTTAVTMARRLNAAMVACASTGNTSASMAAYAARAGMQSIVFIPKGQIAYGKLSQALDYGARTLQIDGDFDKAMHIVEDVCNRGNVYLLNSINPFRIEGQKTIMIELLHQLDWTIPDWILVPGGNLGNSSAFGKAFSELLEWGFIDTAPRIGVIQAQGANPLYSAYQTNTPTLYPVHADTRATAIKIGNPVSFDKSWHAVAATGGIVEQVSEDEIARAKCMIGRDGIGAEPASATTVAGCKKLISSGVIHPGDRVVCILTGHLLKDPDYTVEFHRNELFLDCTRTTSVTGTKRIDTGGMSNTPVTCPADADAILEYIRQSTSTLPDCS